MKKWPCTDNHHESAPGLHTVQQGLGFHHVALIIADLRVEESKRMIKGKLEHRIHYRVRLARKMNMIIMKDKEYQVGSRIKNGQN